MKFFSVVSMAAVRCYSGMGVRRIMVLLHEQLGFNFNCFMLLIFVPFRCYVADVPAIAFTYVGPSMRQRFRAYT